MSSFGPKDPTEFLSLYLSSSSSPPTSGQFLFRWSLLASFSEVVARKRGEAGSGKRREFHVGRGIPEASKRVISGHRFRNYIRNIIHSRSRAYRRRPTEIQGQKRHCPVTPVLEGTGLNIWVT